MVTPQKEGYSEFLSATFLSQAPYLSSNTLNKVCNASQADQGSFFPELSQFSLIESKFIIGQTNAAGLAVEKYRQVVD